MIASITSNSTYNRFLFHPLNAHIHSIHKYLLSAPRAVIRGIRSIERADERQQEEDQRCQDRTNPLRAEGLNKFGHC